MPIPSERTLDGEQRGALFLEILTVPGSCYVLPQLLFCKFYSVTSFEDKFTT